MLLQLQTAISDLLKADHNALFGIGGPVSISFAAQPWTFDALSADPVAGEAGPEDAVDHLAFNPLVPGGPYVLTRPPYPSPKRVYLRTRASDLVALGTTEVLWNAVGDGFTLAPRSGRDLSEVDQVQVLYGVLAAGTRIKSQHRLHVGLEATDPAKAEQAMVLALASLALNREALRNAGGFSHRDDQIQTQATVSSLSLEGGVPTAVGHELIVRVEIDLRVQRLLNEAEGGAIVQISSPGKARGGRSVDIDPVVQA